MEQIQIYFLLRWEVSESALWTPTIMLEIFSCIPYVIHVLFFHPSGFDTHSNVEEALNARFTTINNAIEAFEQEMKLAGLWNNVTIVQTSDFARTLNPNSGDGTDHAWGGNYMMMGKTQSNYFVDEFLSP